MNVVRLAWAFLSRRWGQALLSVLVGGLGVAAVETVLIAERELPKAAERAFGGVDLVIGPKGSALDLVLCCVLHVADPRGLVPLEAGMALAKTPLVRAAAPLALGDNLHGWRIVGTTPDLLTVYGAHLAQGETWSGPLQAVLGAEVARATHLKIGDNFVGAHGLAAGGEEHAEFPYRVTGILAPSGSALDRLVLASIDTVYEIHRHHEAEEATEQGRAPPVEAPPAASAILVAFRSPVALASLPRMIDASEQFSAASPALEMARLARAARPVIVGALAVGILFALIAAATAATALAAAMSGRVRDLALLRALGSHPWEIATIAASESAMLALAALLLGLAAVIGFAPLAASLIAEREGLILVVFPTGDDLMLLAAGTLAAALIAACFPALRAARAPIEKVLNA
jgi:putative ABC transport system permease protein